MNGQEMLAEAVLASKSLMTRYTVGFNDQNCTHQTADLPNHAVWCLGHCALTMQRVSEYIDGKPIPSADFVTGGLDGADSCFHRESIAFGSIPTSDPGSYPPLARAIEVYESACDRLASAVRSADFAALDRTIPWGHTELALWFIVLRVTFHNGMHGGQITDLRRTLGLNPVIK